MELSTSGRRKKRSKRNDKKSGKLRFIFMCRTLTCLYKEYVRNIIKCVKSILFRLQLLVNSGKIRAKMAQGRQIRDFLGVTRGASRGVYLGDKYRMSLRKVPI